MKTTAIRVYEAGGPDVLREEQIDLSAPGPAEVLIRHTAIGVNLVDTYHRTAITGQYAISRPATLGVEAAGVVEAVGEEASEFKSGDRVAYSMLLGAYAERRLAPAWRLVKIPEGVSDQAAAALLLKGSTAYCLLHDVWRVKKEDTILVHAAAGGVGRLLCQWASHLGATVIGTVGSPEKVASASASGCAHVLVLRGHHFAAETRHITAGRGVDVVYDSIGAETFDGSLNALRPFGMMVSFGQASGPIPPLDISILAQKGSLSLSKPTLATRTATREGINTLAEAVFAALLEGAIIPEIGLTAPLREVADIHRAIEARKTTGSTILLP